MTTPTPPRDVLDSIEQRIQESAPLLDRLRECHARIGRMCAERRGPRMSIPAEWHDDDMFICTTIEEAYDRIERALPSLAELERDAGPTFTTGHCANHRARGGCQLHNLQCGYPDCDRRPARAKEGKS